MVVGPARLWDPPIRPARETRQSEDAPTMWDQPVRFGGPPVRFVGPTTAAQAQLTKIIYLKVCGVGYKHKDRCSLVARRGWAHREVLGLIPSPRALFILPPHPPVRLQDPPVRSAAGPARQVWDTRLSYQVDRL
jgi:hypothetical protein